jgi:type I restriction enzyme S subunit
VRESKIPLAPLPEQQRIADKLDSLLSRVDSCRERLDRVPSILKRFRQSVLAAATSGKLTEDWREENGIDSVWELKPLSDVVSDLEQGWSPKCENHPTSNNEHWAVIKTTAIQELRFDEVENKALPTSLEPRPRFELQAGDILITRAGPRIRCGVACYVPTVRPKLMLCDKAYRFRAIEAHVRPEYVATALNAPAAVFAIDKLKTGISESGMNLTQTKFKELEIPCPSLDEQDEILRRVGDLFSFADNIDMQYQNACKRVSRLTPSLLAKAFRGQLVPQDPNDEPASVLLERIRAAKPNIKAKTSRRKAKTKAT